MKIVILIKSYFKYNPGGSEHQGLLFAQEMVKRGYEVHYIFINSSNNDVPMIDEGINLHPLKPMIANVLTGKPTFIYKKIVLKLLNKINPNVIYHRNLNPFLGFAVFYGKKSKCKVLWHIAHLNDVNQLKIKYKWNPLVSYLNNKWIKYGIENVDHIITQEDEHGKKILENFGKSNTLKINKFFPICEKEDKLNSKINVYWIANIRPFKQLELFLHLADKIKDNNIEFVVIGKNGKSQYHKELQSQIKKILNLKYMGPKKFNEINNLLSKGHILVNTSKNEGGAPVTFLQAWMNSIPIISLNHNPDKILTKNKIGFHSKNIEQLIKDVMLLSKNHVLRNKMGELSRNYAIEHYSMKNIDKIEALFNK